MFLRCLKTLYSTCGVLTGEHPAAHTLRSSLTGFGHQTPQLLSPQPRYIIPSSLALGGMFGALALLAGKVDLKGSRASQRIASESQVHLIHRDGRDSAHA